jgi:hypothetical protein
VERANRDVEQVLRGSMRQCKNWVSLLKPAQFALTTAYSRALGTSPFQVVHGFPPRMPLDSALGVSPSSSDLDPASFGQELASNFLSVANDVRARHRRIHEEHARAAAKRKAVQRDFDVGDFVLVRSPHPGRLEVGWNGPFLIKGKDTGATNVYMCESLVDGNVDRVHSSRLRSFVIGNLDLDKLRAEATPDDEYLIDRVLDHDIGSDKEICFRVVWAGFPDLGPSHPDQWVVLKDCHWSPPIKDYIKKHRLSSAVRARIKALGPLPRS